MNANQNIEALTRATVVDRDGDKVGGVGQVFLDDQTGQPTWVTVNTGLFGSKETFVPLQDAQVTGEEIRVPYEKGFIKDAPNMDVDQHLSAEEEQELYRYYNLQAGGYAQDRAALGGDIDRDRAHDKPAVEQRAAGEPDRHREGGDSMVAHEERLNVGTEQREAGQVRLRKHVVTETQQVEVPVQREELHVERERVGERVTDHRIGEDTEEEVITLHEERPVVSKETVATERVDVSKETVQDTQTVQADVQKEQIEVHEDGRHAEGTRNPLDRDNDGQVRDDLDPRNH